MWGCDQGHDYTMDADSSCGALLLDSALGVKWTWDKDSGPRLPQHLGFNPTGLPLRAPKAEQLRRGLKPRHSPASTQAGFLQMVTQWGPGPGPRLSQASPKVGPQVGGSSGLLDPVFLVLSQAGPLAGSGCCGGSSGRGAEGPA